MKKLSHILPPHPACNTTQPAYPILISLPSYFSPPAFSLPLPPPPPSVCLHNNNGAANAFFWWREGEKEENICQGVDNATVRLFYREGRGETNQDPPGAIIILKKLWRN